MKVGTDMRWVRLLFAAVAAAVLVASQAMAYLLSSSALVIIGMDVVLFAAAILLARRWQCGVVAAAVIVPTIAVALRFVLATTGHHTTVLGAVVDLLVGIGHWQAQVAAFFVFVLVVAFMLLRGPTESRAWWFVICAVLLLLSVPIAWPPIFR